MEGIKLSQESMDELADQVLERIKSEGLVVVHKAVAMDGLEMAKKRANLMRRKTVSPYEIVKYKLLPGVSSVATIYNMIADERIKEDEYFMEGKNYRVFTTAINRLNGN